MKILLSLFATLFPAAALAGSMTITYTRPAQYTDGTTLPADVRLRYVVYAAREGEPLVEVQSAEEVLRQVVIVSAGRWCAQVYAVNGNVWSDGSPNPAWCGTVPAAPSEPPPTRKTRPAGNVVVTPSHEEPAP